MESFEQKAEDVFSEIVINKYYVHQAGFGSRAIPTYVREWIISHAIQEFGDLNDKARGKIANFVQKYVPDKSQKETIKNQLYQQIEVKLLDNYSVYVDLAGGNRYLNIPFLDESHAFVLPQIIEDNEMLLSSGLWGVGTLFYIPNSPERGRGEIWMREFEPFQLANLDLDYFRDCRRIFTTQEWIDLIISSMGFNPKIYSERQKILLICRLLPMVEPRYNLVELAPKGTGKSFVYENISRYVAIRSGAVTPAVMFFNDHTKTPGLITRYDCVVIDEAQKVKADTSGELTALLKSYLEAGRFARGSAGSISAEAGLVMLANIELDHHKRPLNEQVGLFRVFPNFLRETAFIDRFSGLLPGWELPRISKKTPSSSIGLKGDIFGEILHSLRGDISFRDFVKTNMELHNCDDMRDSRAIEAGATALLKILFPDQNPTEEEFYFYCVNPAIELRQRVRDELCKMDREYTSVTFLSKYPDQFQRNHPTVSFVEVSEEVEPNLPEERDYPQIDFEEEFRRLRQTSPESQPGIDKDADQPTEKTLHIQDGETGYSYQKLFGPYLRGARRIEVVDPYIRLEYQIRNFLSFANLIDTSAGKVALELTTSAEDEYQQKYLEQKFHEMAESLAKHGIILTVRFDPAIHDRSIRCDNGWSIYPGRGLDIYQKPSSKYELSEIDQAKRKCRETEIVYLKTGD